jgi:hypothetical protein
MKHILFVLVAISLSAMGCRESQPVKVFYGEKFEVLNPISADLLIDMVDAGKVAEDIQVEGLIEKSCTHSGCWLMLENTKGAKIIVTYKDESFTTAKNIKDRKATLLGNATYDSEKETYNVVASGLILN